MSLPGPSTVEEAPNDNVPLTVTVVPEPMATASKAVVVKEFVMVTSDVPNVNPSPDVFDVTSYNDWLFPIIDAPNPTDCISIFDNCGVTVPLVMLSVPLILCVALAKVIVPVRYRSERVWPLLVKVFPDPFMVNLPPNRAF